MSDAATRRLREANTARRSTHNDPREARVTRRPRDANLLVAGAPYFRDGDPFGRLVPSLRAIARRAACLDGGDPDDAR
jgi:hypothetical protein